MYQNKELERPVQKQDIFEKESNLLDLEPEDNLDAYPQKNQIGSSKRAGLSKDDKVRKVNHVYSPAKIEKSMQDSEAFLQKLKQLQELDAQLTKLRQSNEVVSVDKSQPVIQTPASQESWGENNSAPKSGNNLDKEQNVLESEALKTTYFQQPSLDKRFNTIRPDLLQILSSQTPVSHEVDKRVEESHIIEKPEDFEDFEEFNEEIPIQRNTQSQKYHENIEQDDFEEEEAQEDLEPDNQEQEEARSETQSMEDDFQEGEHQAENENVFESQTQSEQAVEEEHSGSRQSDYQSQREGSDSLNDNEKEYIFEKDDLESEHGRKSQIFYDNEDEPDHSQIAYDEQSYHTDSEDMKAEASQDENGEEMHSLAYYEKQDNMIAQSITGGDLMQVDQDSFMQGEFMDQTKDGKDWDQVGSQRQLAERLEFEQMSQERRHRYQKSNYGKSHQPHEQMGVASQDSELKEYRQGKQPFHSQQSLLVQSQQNESIQNQNFEEISANEAISASNTIQESFGPRASNISSLHMAASAPSFGDGTKTDFDQQTQLQDKSDLDYNENQSFLATDYFGKRRNTSQDENSQNPYSSNQNQDDETDLDIDNELKPVNIPKGSFDGFDDAILQNQDEDEQMLEAEVAMSSILQAAENENDEISQENSSFKSSSRIPTSEEGSQKAFAIDQTQDDISEMQFDDHSDLGDHDPLENYKEEPAIDLKLPVLVQSEVRIMSDINRFMILSIQSHKQPPEFSELCFLCEFTEEGKEKTSQESQQYGFFTIDQILECEDLDDLMSCNKMHLMYYCNLMKIEHPKIPSHEDIQEIYEYDQTQEQEVQQEQVQNLPRPEPEATQSKEEVVDRKHESPVKQEDVDSEDDFIPNRDEIILKSQKKEQVKEEKVESSQEISIPTRGRRLLAKRTAKPKVDENSQDEEPIEMKKRKVQESSDEEVPSLPSRPIQRPKKQWNNEPVLRTRSGRQCKQPEKYTDLNLGRRKQKEVEKEALRKSQLIEQTEQTEQTEELQESAGEKEEDMEFEEGQATVSEEDLDLNDGSSSDAIEDLPENPEERVKRAKQNKLGIFTKSNTCSVKKESSEDNIEEEVKPTRTRRRVPIVEEDSPVKAAPSQDQDDQQIDYMMSEQESSDSRIGLTQPLVGQGEAKWVARHRELHNQACELKQKKIRIQQMYGGDDARKEQKAAMKLALEKSKTTSVTGNFEQGHEPVRIRSLRKRKQSKKEKEEIVSTKEFSPFYGLVKCTVEWQQKNGALLKISDSKNSYAELRKKAPHLLCEYFERHMVFI